jgi:alpha-L-glutamate ligase-like protein
MSFNGILGMNERNLSFIRPYNKKRAVRLADDKLATKELLIKTGISTPKLFGVIKTVKDFEKFDWKKIPANFVIKPNRGLGGEGIIILRRSVKKERFLKLTMKNRKWLSSSGEEWDFDKLKSHILDILDGSFSLQGLPDTAFIERKLVAHPAFKDYIRKGIPDIRIIVFNRVPVMAMLRLPTEKSKGRANIAQGAIAAGVDISSGITTTAMTKSPYRRIIEIHPDTDQQLSGLEIPDWDKILEMSIESQIASNINYLGCDIAIDKRHGPEILELNARPGLDIQVANLEGLASRLKRVKGLKVKSVSHGVRIAKDLFGGDIERRVEHISKKEVIGSFENVEIFHNEGKEKINIEAKIDTGADSTSIDIGLAEKIGFKDLKYLEAKSLDPSVSDKQVKNEALKLKNELKKVSKEIIDVTWVRSSHGLSLRPRVKIVFMLSGVKVMSKANITKRGLLKYKMIVGRKDLKNFLIDPIKK